VIRAWKIMAGSVSNVGNVASQAVASLDNAARGLTGALVALTSPVTSDASASAPVGAVGPALPGNSDVASVPLPQDWRMALAEVILDPAADGDMTRAAVTAALIAANALDPAGGTGQVAQALEDLRNRFMADTDLDNGVEVSVAIAVRNDPQLVAAFALIQLDTVRAGGSTLTPYQEGIFLQKFRERIFQYDTDDARSQALSDAQAGPLYPPGTDPETPVNRDNFDLGSALLVLSPSGYAMTNAGTDVFGRSYQNFMRIGDVDDNPYTLEITNYSLIDGVFSEGSAQTRLDDGSFATISFVRTGYGPSPDIYRYTNPDGRVFQNSTWGVMDGPRGLDRFKALAEGTTPPALPVVPLPPTPSPTPAPAPPLPEPQLPPGVEPGNEKGLGGADYLATSGPDAGRIAYNLLQYEPFGNFVLVLRDTNTGQYWVTGPFPGDMTASAARARFPINFELISTLDRPRITMPIPVMIQESRPAGSLNAKIYPAENRRDAVNLARLAYLNYTGSEEPYYMVLRSRITDRYYMDGPFLASEISVTELERSYSSNLVPVFDITPN
jgi:hypothetical protein